MEIGFHSRKKIKRERKRLRGFEQGRNRIEFSLLEDQSGRSVEDRWEGDKIEEEAQGGDHCNNSGVRRWSLGPGVDRRDGQE